MAWAKIKWIYIIVAVALLLRLVYVLKSPYPPLFGDALGYDAAAKQLIEKGFLGYNKPYPNAVSMPGFPLLLAAVYLAFGTKVIWFQLLQVLFSTLTVWSVYALAVILIGRRYAMIAAAAMAVYPSFLYANGLVLTETTFTLLFSLFLLTLLKGLDSGRRGMLFGAGLFLGASVLLRPTPALLVIPLIIYFAIAIPSRTIVWRAILYVGAASFLLLVPWWVRNYFVYGQFVLFTTLGGNPLLWGVRPYLVGVLEQLNTIKLAFPDEALRNKEWIQQAQTFFLSHLHEPLYIKWFVFGKLTLMWKDPWAETGGFAYAQLARPIHFLIVTCGWIGLVLSVFKKQRIQVFAVIVLYYSLVHQSMLSISRYVFPIMPYMIILSVYALKLVIDRLRRWRSREASAPETRISPLYIGWAGAVTVYALFVLYSLFMVDLNKEEILWRKIHATLIGETFYSSLGDWSSQGVRPSLENGQASHTVSPESSVTSPLLPSESAKQTYIGIDMKTSSNLVLIYWKKQGEEYSADRMKAFKGNKPIEWMIDADVSQIRIHPAPGQPQATFGIQNVRIQKYN